MLNALWLQNNRVIEGQKKVETATRYVTGGMERMGPARMT